ncbi:DUF1501 domain-containing protein, partial [Singulisphaera rosea]
MIIVPGQPGKDLCDRSLGVTRRDLLRVGGSGLLGMSLGSMLELKAAVGADQAGIAGRPGWGKAKSIIMVYLQGGPSHLDLWDPKDNVPDNVRSSFKAIPTKTPGTHFTEILPKLSQITDKFTLLRAMSYTPNGLFNHTAAIYQMMTGYTTDKVSPSGQLEPPSPKDFPNFGSNIIRLQPPTQPMLPFVMLPRPLQESGVVGKGGTAGFLGKAFDPYTLYPDGDDMDLAKMDRIKIDDLQLRPEVFSVRLERRAKLRQAIDSGMPELEKAVSDYNLNQYYDKALRLIISGRAREAFNIAAEPDKIRDMYGRNTFGQSCLLARRLIERGVRFVTVNMFETVFNEITWDIHGSAPFSPIECYKNEVGPNFDTAYSALIEDLSRRGMLENTMILAFGEFGRTPKVNPAGGRDHHPACWTVLFSGGPIKGGQAVGASDETGYAPKD